MEPKSERSRPFKDVLEVCHDLDLFRCYGQGKMQSKVDKVTRDTGQTASAYLVDLAEATIISTGDRLMCSTTGNHAPRGYQAPLFTDCSRDPAVCWERIITTAAEIGAKHERLRRTFASSQFNVIYTASEAPRSAVQFLAALENFICAYCSYIGVDRSHGEAFSAELQKNAIDNDAVSATEYVTDRHAVAQRLWTSPAKFNGKTELCSIINEAIRSDDPTLIKFVAPVCRVISHLSLSRMVLSQGPFPQDSCTYRGAVLPEEHRSFFTAGKSYRVPGYLATSFKRSQAEMFMQRAHQQTCDAGTPHPRVLWKIRVDPSGRDNPARRCKHASYVTKTDLPGV